MTYRDPEQLAAVAAHDLRGHLVGMDGYAQLLSSLEAVKEDATARTMVEQISLGAQHGLTLVDDLLTFATCLWRQDVPSPVDLDALAAHVVPRVLGEHDPSSVRIGPLGTVHGDPALLRHLLRHLLVNALTYVAPGVAPRVEISAVPVDDGLLQVRVADNGLGIAVDEREVVFEAFERGTATASVPGTGLGLAICRRVVTRYGGQIGVEDSPYGGTSVWFTLPSGPPVG